MCESARESTARYLIRMGILLFKTITICVLIVAALMCLGPAE